MEASVCMSDGAMCRGASWFEVVAVTAEGCVSKAVGIAQGSGSRTSGVEGRGRVEGVGVGAERSVWLLRFGVLYRLSPVPAHRSSSGLGLFRILRMTPHSIAYASEWSMYSQEWSVHKVSTRLFE